MSKYFHKLYLHKALKYLYLVKWSKLLLFVPNTLANHWNLALQLLKSHTYIGEEGDDDMTIELLKTGLTKGI